MEGVPTETMQALMAILTEERLEKGGSDAEAATAEMMEEAMGHMSPLMDKLKEEPILVNNQQGVNFGKLGFPMGRSTDYSWRGRSPGRLKADPVHCDAKCLGLVEQ